MGNKNCIVKCILFLTIFIAIVVGLHKINETKVGPYPVFNYIENISVWDHGKLVQTNFSDGFADALIYTAQQVNLQARCVLFEENIEDLKQNGKIIIIVFKKPVNISESNIGLQNVEKLVFVLEGDFNGHVLVKNKYSKAYGCWAIKKGENIDKSWVDKIPL